jgi:hypothetical protein
MWLVAQIVFYVLPGPRGQLVRLALTGRQVQPRMTVRPADHRPARRDRRRRRPCKRRLCEGTGFPDQIHRAGFRDTWDTLDTATVTLERGIADDQRLGLGAASGAQATAADAERA